MEPLKDEIWILITRNLSGEATWEEEAKLNTWLAEDSEHRTIYKLIKEAWEEEPDGSVDNPFMYNYKSGLQKLRTKIDTEEEKQQIDILQFGYNRTSVKSTWKAAASILLIVVSLSVFVTIQIWEKPTVSYTTSAVEQRIISLPDGSEVRLNKNSKLQFQENFSGDSREVYLEGEAFFDVQKNPNRPFIVYISDAAVKVLGTSFSIKEAENIGETLVAVKDGLVTFRATQTEENGAVRLSAGQLGFIDRESNQVNVAQADVENYLSWINGKLIFESTPLDDVCFQLGKIYDLKCELSSPSLKSKQLTVYTENTQLEEVIYTIALSLDIEYQMEDNKIVWMEE